MNTVFDLSSFCLFLTPGTDLIWIILRLCQHHSENKEGASDEQLQALFEITSEFLADLCIHIPKVIFRRNSFTFPSPVRSFVLQINKLLKHKCFLLKKVNHKRSHLMFSYVYFSICTYFFIENYQND